MSDPVKTDQPAQTPTPAPTPAAVPVGQHEELHKLIDILKENGKSAAIALAVVAVVIGGVKLYRNRVAAAQTAASNLLFAARSIQDLDNLVARYQSTSIAPLAMLKLAKAHFDSGAYEPAMGKYVEFGTKFPKHPWAAVAELGKIHCQEAIGQTEQALAGFSAFVEQHPGHFLKSEAVFGRGRCLETLGRLSEAKAVYEDFIAANPDSGWVSRAEELLEQVKRKLGESAGSVALQAATTNAVAAPVEQK